MSFETHLAHKAASYQNDFSGQLQRDSKLWNQIVSMKDTSDEPIDDPASPAETFPDSFCERHRRRTDKSTPSFHKEVIFTAPLHIKASVVQHLRASLKSSRWQGLGSRIPAVIKAIAPQVARPLADLLSLSLASVEEADG